VRAQVWDAVTDAAVEAAIRELTHEFPDAQVSVRELVDDRGTVAVAVTVGDGRLVIGARVVELAPVAWPFRLADGVVGVLPAQRVPTVAEFVAGLIPVPVPG
jgi:hypothetical protein